MSSDDLSQFVSRRIRHFRKLHRMTLEELGRRICKSKSTLSKYENGQIVVDVRTLQEIADALDISIVNFFSTQPQIEFPIFDSGDISNTQLQTMYLYHWDARPHRRKLYQSVLQLDSNSGRCQLYWAVPDVTSFTKCDYMFYGHRLHETTSSRFLLFNYTNKMDMLVINYLDDLACREFRTSGSLTSMSVGQYECYTTKCIITNHPLERDESLKQTLIISKQAVSDIKKTNVFRMNRM